MATPRIGPRRLWLTAVPLAVGFVLVVLASYHIARDNDRRASPFVRRAP